MPQELSPQQQEQLQGARARYSELSPEGQQAVDELSRRSGLAAIGSIRADIGDPSGLEQLPPPPLEPPSFEGDGALQEGISHFATREGPSMMGAFGVSKLMMPLGPPGMAIGGGIGGAGGEAIAQKMHGEETDWGRIAEMGGWGMMQEAGPALRMARETSMAGRSLNAAERFGPPSIRGGAIGARAIESGVPMTQGQLTQSTARNAVESVLRRAIFASRIMQDFGRKQATSLKKAADEIANLVSKPGRSRMEWGEWLQGTVEGYHKFYSDAYGEALQQISRRGAGNLELNLSGEMVLEARRLVSKMQAPGDFPEVLQGAEGGLKQASKRLGGLTETFKNVLEGPRTGGPGELGVLEDFIIGDPKRLTFDEAIVMRRIFLDVSRRGQSSTGTGALQKMVGVIDEEIGNTLRQRGKADVYKLWRNASSGYKRMMEVTGSRVIKAARAEQSAETIIVKLLGAKGIDLESKVKLLQEVAMDQGDEVIARGVFEWAFEKSLTEGIPLGGAFERLWEGLGTGAKERLFRSNPEIIGRVERFANTLDTVSLTPDITKPASALSPSLMALGQGSAIAGGVADMVFNLSGAGLMLGGTTVGVAAFGPALLAKLITRKGGTELAMAALRTPANTKAGQKLISVLEAFSKAKGALMMRAPSLTGRALSTPPYPGNEAPPLAPPRPYSRDTVPTQ